MLLGNATGTQSAAIQGVQMGAFLLSLLLSGFLVPIRNIPPAIRWISYILPATFYVQVVQNSLLRNAKWSAVWGPGAGAGDPGDRLFRPEPVPGSKDAVQRMRRIACPPFCDVTWR